MPRRRLCDPCKEAKEHQGDNKSFLRSVGQECYICIWIQRKFSQIDVHRTTYCWNSPGDGKYRTPRAFLELEVGIYDHSTQELGLRCWFQILDTIVEEKLIHIMRTSLFPSMKAKETFDMAREWIMGCRSKHIGCWSTTTRRELPTRLIHVRSRAADLPLEANICRGSTLPTETPYLTLSHCWGKRKFLTSTRANISLFEAYLPIQRLSRTFQDALFATISLGFQYIWIDSLCIVQDDEDDWRRESVVMHHVYKNTVCNILASRSTDEDSGFISDHRLLDPTPLPFDFRFQSSNTKLNGPENDCVNTKYMIRNNPWADLERGQLYQRAWVLQEQLLAPRALHFGEDQVFWECKGTLANEVWPFGWSETGFERDLQSFLKINVWQFKVDVGHTDRHSLYRTWVIIIRDFTKRNLTYASDCLPALSGIANEFAVHLEDDYVYGLWSNDIHREILFSQIGDDITIDEPDWGNIPSWSWVALHEPVIWTISLYYSNNYLLCDINLNRHEQRLLLRLRGTPMVCPSRYKELRISGTRQIKGYETYGTDPCGFYLYFRPDYWFFWVFSEGPFKQDADDLGSMRTRYHKASGFQADAFLESIIVIPILHYKYSSLNKSSEFPFTIHMKCLLLVPHANSQNGVYRRVGTLESTKESCDEMDFEAIKAQLWPDQKPLSSNLFQEQHEDGTYTITIV